MFTIRSAAALLVALTTSTLALPADNAEVPSLPLKGGPPVSLCAPPVFNPVPNKAPTTDCSELLRRWQIGIVAAWEWGPAPGGIYQLDRWENCAMWLDSPKEVYMGGQDLIDLLSSAISGWTDGAGTGATGSMACEGGTVHWTVSTAF